MNLIHGDQHTLDKKDPMNYACNAQIYLRCEKKYSSEENLNGSNEEDLSSLLFCNYEFCILGNFSKMCSSIHLANLQVKIADWLRQNKERIEEKAIF